MIDVKRTITLTGIDEILVLGITPTDEIVVSYWGPPVRGSDVAMDDWQAPSASVDAALPPCLFPLYGFGFMGEPALLAHRPGKSNVFYPTLRDCSTTISSVKFTMVDDIEEVQIDIDLSYQESGVIRSQVRLENTGSVPLNVQRLNALSMPLPDWCREIDATFGHWGGEGYSCRVPLTCGKFERSLRGGKPGFDGGPNLLIGDGTHSDNKGRVVGLTLAHSGNFQVAVERTHDGRAHAFLSEWLSPGELVLQSGESYQTPFVFAALSQRGINGVSQKFHELAFERSANTCNNRPVSLNTWEALYFDVNESEIIRLATAAAKLGCERLVIDDGWFSGRIDDRSGLGDWRPDPIKFPAGFSFLRQLKSDLGIEFGIWLEPEMVNPNSELARLHPGWVISDRHGRKLTGRNQWVLDLSLDAVVTFLFENLSDLLERNPFTYIKWDCNRDLFPALSNGQPSARTQVLGLYRLLKKLRRAHPSVAIESCASGGGRIDFGILPFVDRFWVSDCTDPIERIRIQRRASVFVPPGLLGAHVSESPNHLTGRESSMAFRCLVVLFGHLGLELDPGALSPTDCTTLKHCIHFFKLHRKILTSGRLVKIDSPDGETDAQIMLSPDNQTCILRILRVAESVNWRPKRFGISGLPARFKWQIEEFEIESGKSEVVATMTSEKLEHFGIDASPSHANCGRLFVLTKIAI